MCGRFNSIASGKDFASVYDAQFLTDELLPNFNVAPTTLVYVLHRQDGGRVLDAMSWGLVPSWSKDKTRAASMINARSETLTEKPSFRNLVSEHRCVLPIQGFYEWQNLPSETKKPRKQAHYISRVDERPMTLAGLWTIWKQPDSSLLRTCTIITTEANEKLSPIHHRMPVILERDSVEIWLGESKALPNDLLIAAKNEIVMSEPTSRLDRASNSSTAQLDDDSSGRLF
jgi:putative SOS response-associated peptidase YedK